MTAQWQHRYITKRGEVLLSSKTPFVPEDYGITPNGGFTTKCRLGYVCEHLTLDNHCVLNRMLIEMRPLLMDQGKVPLEEYPLLNGKAPRAFFLTPKRWIAIYEDIGLKFNSFLEEKDVAFRPPEELSEKEQASWRQSRFKFISVADPFVSPKKRKKPRHLLRSPLAGASSATVKKTPERKSLRELYPFRESLIMGYDIIGDIHGHADELESLLKKLGYSIDAPRGPKRRRLIFLGDFIDRGLHNRRVVEIIRKFIRADLAFAVMGNHEYNAICYNTPSEINGTEYLREHTEKNKAQHQAFLNDYPDKAERDNVIRWFQRLPLFLDLQKLRIVHACWEQVAIDYVETRYGNRLTNEFLHKSIDKGNKEHSVIETLLKGPERPLRSGLSFSDTDGNTRRNFRLKWWKDELESLGDAAILPNGSLVECLDEALVKHCEEHPISTYPVDAPPVFFGHYALPMKDSFTRNTACLDYNIIGGGSLACLRWNKAEKDILPAEMEVTTVSSRS